MHNHLIAAFSRLNVIFSFVTLLTEINTRTYYPHAIVGLPPCYCRITPCYCRITPWYCRITPMLLSDYSHNILGLSAMIIFDYPMIFSDYPPWFTCLHNTGLFIRCLRSTQSVPQFKQIYLITIIPEFFIHGIKVSRKYYIFHNTITLQFHFSASVC